MQYILEHPVLPGTGRGCVFCSNQLVMGLYLKKKLDNEAEIGVWQITESEAATHPNKHMITRAVGVEKIIEVDFDQVELRDEETLILCTDGLTNYVTDADMRSEISDGQYYAFADRLVKRANSNGGGDNITVVAIAN